MLSSLSILSLVCDFESGVIPPCQTPPTLIPVFSLLTFAALLFQRWSKSFSIPEAYVATLGGVWPDKKHWLFVGWVCLQTPGNTCFTWISVFEMMVLSCCFVPCVLSESFLSVLWSLFTLQDRESDCCRVELFFFNTHVIFSPLLSNSFHLQQKNANCMSSFWSKSVCFTQLYVIYNLMYTLTSVFLYTSAI